MVKRLVVYGLLGMALAIVLSRQYTVDRPDAEMVVIVNPVNPLNPVVKNPYQEEYEKLLYPVVRITSDSGTGSGAVISNTNHTNKDEWTRIDILTAAHVVEDQNIVNIEFYSLEVITGTVVITDTIKDLALIRVIRSIRDICVKDIYSAKLAPRDYTPYLFTPIWAVGCSLGLPPRPSQGIISVVESDHWEVTSPILPGNSGGPVFDGRTYEVIGIAVWVKVYDGQLVTTMAGVVPITEIYNFLENHFPAKAGSKSQ